MSAQPLTIKSCYNLRLSTCGSNSSWNEEARVTFFSSFLYLVSLGGARARLPGALADHIKRDDPTSGLPSVAGLPPYRLQLVFVSSLQHLICISSTKTNFRKFVLHGCFFLKRKRTLKSAECLIRFPLPIGLLTTTCTVDNIHLYTRQSTIKFNW